MFLAVLAVATVLEVVVIATVLRPLAAQRGHERAELALDRAARGIAALYDPYDLKEIERVLAEHRPGDPGAFLVLGAWDGRIVTDPELTPATRARATAVIARSDSAGAGEVEVLGRRPVTIEGNRFGEVLALGPRERASLWALPETRTLALFLPFAVLAAGTAGLLMVRFVARRLRALEHVAARVAAGELSARVPASGHDEIGQLESRFNVMTESLAGARDRLEEIDRQRRQLFADITHELATPLTSIRGYVETMLNPRVPISPEERTTYLEDVLEEARRLDALVSELLELTRLEAGATPLQRIRLDWAALCRNTARRMGPRFTEAGLRLEWSGLDREAWIRADGRRIEQVVDNLLTNALRYVPAGGTVRGALEEATDADGAARWRLAVSDDGPGIAAEDLLHVFDRFYRSEAVRAQGGTGLGLAIVREIVRQHGGDVSASHAAPRGARFTVELPAER